MNHSRMGLVLGWGWGRAVPAGGWRLWGAEAGRRAGDFVRSIGKMGYYYQCRRYKVLSKWLELLTSFVRQSQKGRQNFIPAAL
ncbi:hypothetical protein [Eisenbergiella porci]|uniref:hypothetical protein n=1 Tax=Eisenbergiella porci TaxID=2652274 RepID=UPI002A7F67C2|nr:hypothetical protein [Eisenbergiella porci]